VPSPAPESDGEVETDQLAFTLESPSRPQLQLFETVFNTGKPLSGYCQDDPLWPLLAEVASPCSNCVKSPGKCKVLPNSPRCTNCSAKKTCSLGKDLRFLELHGTPAHQSTWGVPLSTWRHYDAALHARTSSTSILLELNMLDDQDTADADQQELRAFLSLQQGEAVVAAKRRSMAASTSTPVPPRAPPSLMEVPGGHPPVQGPSSLVQLAAVAEAQSGLVQQPVIHPATRTPIKGTGPDLLSSNMPPAPRPNLVPRALAAPPYRAENQCLAACVQLLESQLENSSLTSALWDTSHALESRHHEVLEHEMEYRHVLDQFVALDEALPGTPGQGAQNRRGETVLLYPQEFAADDHLVDESNALATRQCCLVEELQEDLHRARDRAAFVEQMVKEYSDEGYYEVVLPPLSQLEGDLNKAREDLRRIATFAHCLHRSDPATVLHHHHRYIGAIIEAVVAFLRRGLESKDLDVVVHNFRLALDYMQAAWGVHGDLYINAVDEDEGLYRMVLEHSRFDNDSPFLTAAQHVGFAPPSDNSLEPPLHRRMFALSTALPHSDGAGMWDDIVPALPSLDQLTTDWEQLMLQYIHHITDTPLSGTDAQVPMSSVEPGTGSLAEVIVQRSFEVSAVPESASSVGPDPQVPLFLPEQESPTSPSPPPPSPTLPPLFGSVADLAIDLTGDDDDLYKTEESRMGRVSVAREVVDLAAVRGIVKEEPL
ncbi:hypothetical protein F5876DRAFT_70937, partial [Lentinula aff. lateritia]